MEKYKGVNYGNTTTNINPDTGIRYGVIPHHAVGSSWYDDAEAFYASPLCPECGGDVVEFDSEKHDDYSIPTYNCCDYACENCRKIFDSSNVYPEEPISWFIKNDEYTAEQNGDDPDIFVFKSPYFTYAQFCSPCAPGACYLLNPVNPVESENTDNKCYCLGQEWFEDEKAPYQVYSVKTGKLV